MIGIPSRRAMLEWDTVRSSSSGRCPSTLPTQRRTTDRISDWAAWFEVLQAQGCCLGTSGSLRHIRSVVEYGRSSSRQLFQLWRSFLRISVFLKRGTEYKGEDAELKEMLETRILGCIEVFIEMEGPAQMICSCSYFLSNVPFMAVCTFHPPLSELTSSPTYSRVAGRPL